VNPAAATRRMAERLSGSSRDQLALRACIGVGTAAVLAVIVLSGGSLALFWTTVVVVAALVTMLIPHDFAPLVLLGLLVWLWAISVPDLTHPSAILVAALLFGIHVLCLLTSYGPPEMVLDATLVKTWGRRTGLAVGAAVAVWLVSWLLAGSEPPGGEWLRIAALGIVLLWTAFLTTRLLRRHS
jgi:hypothetical protein